MALRRSVVSFAIPLLCLVLGLAGCMAADIVDIVRRGRHSLTGFSARIVAHRAQEPPARIVRAELHFHVRGDVPSTAVERAIALSGSAEIQPDDLQLAPPAAVEEPRAPNAKWPLQDYLDRLEREAILEALDKTRFNRTAAAKLLGITFRALRYRMERLGIH